MNYLANKRVLKFMSIFIVFYGVQHLGENDINSVTYLCKKFRFLIKARGQNTSSISLGYSTNTFKNLQAVSIGAQPKPNDDQRCNCISEGTLKKGMIIGGAARHSLLQDLSKKLRAGTRDSGVGVFLRQNISLAVQRGNAANVMATVEEGQKLEFGGRYDDFQRARLNAILELPECRNAPHEFKIGDDRPRPEDLPTPRQLKATISRQRKMNNRERECILKNTQRKHNA
ncbi:hypothetical protein ACOME3_005187 [Neoechinorhynchus agilis]